MHFLIGYCAFYYTVYPLINNTMLVFPNVNGMYHKAKWFSFNFTSCFQ